MPNSLTGTMRLLLSFASLFLSVVLLQLSSGAIGPLDTISGAQVGFSVREIGLMGSAHFVGFFIGCWSAPRLIGSVGHVRSFAAFAALGTIGALAHPMVIDPLAWSFFRVFTGLAVAGCYTVVEAWLQAKVTNETRGRALGTYRLIDLVASLGAQLMIGFLPPVEFISYNIIAMFMCACVLPLMLTKSVPPITPQAPRLRPLKAIGLSPLAAMGVIVAGVTTPAFRMVSPLYAIEIGLDASQIGFFLAIAILGGALAQFPAGWLADRYDRRHVLIGLSFASLIVCGTTASLSDQSVTLIFALSMLFGATTFPIFSVSAAHACDFAEADFMVDLTAALMFLYGLGAIASPFVGSVLIEAFGPRALYIMIASVHLILAVFGLIRMTRRPTSGDKTRYAYLPRTTFILGRLMGRSGPKP